MSALLGILFAPSLVAVIVVGSIQVLDEMRKK